MGNQRHYNPEGGFSDYLYHSVGDIIEADGLTGKVIEKNGPGPNNLPNYSNTSTYYFKIGKDGHVDQMRVYENRKMKVDFDWGHDHTDKTTGRVFPKGVVHVQTRGIDGHTATTRMMNNAEIKKYKNFLRAADPNVRFRP
ncbi:MAG: hypothetical protein IJ057_13105 [Bacteroidales bacterium]|nr:hypothetical protein [Bacteroidales bacterium]